ncbi:hypothetical protein BKA83DRAFT_4487015 [Pisolithus microcarpus]|nr:hypothetical protein BKA83DRAFT_4487015 [Pisolithus microcarpus]
MPSLDDSIMTCLTTCHEQLVASSLYLSDSSITTRLHWVPEGQGHVLMYEPHMADGAVHDPGCSNALVDESGSVLAQSPDLSLSPPLVPAELCAIVHIDWDNLWLTSDGSYLGPNAICKGILDVKPSCALSNLGMEPVASDFATVLQMLWALTQQCVTHGFTSGISFFSSVKNRPPTFKLHHQLFERIDTGLADEEEPGTSMSTEDAFSFKLWPL